jgi:hypothetical protein
MNNEDCLRISQYRDDIYDWACDRFKQLIAEDQVDNALAFADEFFEWLDPEQLDNEVTLFFNENELREHYADSNQ